MAGCVNFAMDCIRLFFVVFFPTHWYGEDLLKIPLKIPSMGRGKISMCYENEWFAMTKISPIS